jgi:hypothetical protein
MNIVCRLVTGSALGILLGPICSAQESRDEQPEAFETVVVTASPGTTTEFRSSISVNSISVDQVEEFAPRGTAEIFRNIPGVRSEAGGGNAGNANIIVRGLPAASGGAKFLQLHEDGLPVLEFGDIAFGNADIFLRADWSVQRIESMAATSAARGAVTSPGISAVEKGPRTLALRRTPASRSKETSRASSTPATSGSTSSTWTTGCAATSPVPRCSPGRMQIPDSRNCPATIS